MNVETYLKRIAYSGPLTPDRATLDGLVKAHLRAVTFENLDQQMGVPVAHDAASIYRKIVLQNRGGWCFELNGLFGWLLQNIGFDVSFLAGHVGVGPPAKNQSPDHMLLRVECGGPLIVDVGFGGAMAAPTPLSPGVVLQPPYRIALTAESGGFYRYSESRENEDAAHWFRPEKVDPGVFDPARQSLQTDPASGFVRTLTAQRRYSGRHVVLRGLVKKTIDVAGTHTETLATPTALVDCLKYDFGLDVPAIAGCWSKLRRRHQEVFAT